MSCLENQIIYESCLEQFWELLEDYDFKAIIAEHFLDAREQWLEKEHGRNAFDILYNWDCEGMASSIKECVNEYIKCKVKNV